MTTPLKRIMSGRSDVKPDGKNPLMPDSVQTKSLRLSIVTPRCRGRVFKVDHAEKLRTSRLARPPAVTEDGKNVVDSHLRSTRALAVYSVEASEHCYDGKKMMILTGKVSRISYEDKAFSVDATKRVLTAAALSASS